VFDVVISQVFDIACEESKRDTTVGRKRESLECGHANNLEFTSMVSLHERICYDIHLINVLTLRLLMSYICGAPCKARNFNVVYIWTYVW
jgi:hypothetical protein